MSDCCLFLPLVSAPALGVRRSLCNHIAADRDGSSVLDNVRASACPTSVRHDLLYHACYLTFTYK